MQFLKCPRFRLLFSSVKLSLAVLIIPDFGLSLRDTIVDDDLRRTSKVPFSLPNPPCPKVWDPVLILAQIVTIQCLFYFSIGIIELVVLGQFVSDISLAYVFDWRKLALKNLAGVIAVFAHLLSAILTSIYIVHIVERSKKCLDFSSTVYIIHLMFCAIYGGLPHNLEWWAVNAFGLGLMALLSEWMCIKKELQEIPLSTFRYRNSTPSQQNTRLQQITAITG